MEFSEASSGSKAAEVIIKDFKHLSIVLPDTDIDWNVWMMLQNLRQTHKVSAWTGPRDRIDSAKLFFNGLDKEAAEEAIGLLSSELSKYPPGYLQTSRVGRFRLVSGLILSLPSETTREGGSIRKLGGRANPDGQLYIDFKPEDLIFTADTIHHELEHRAHSTDLIEASRADVLATKNDCNSWESLNPGGSSRYIGERYWNLAVDDPIRRDYDGFLTFYGRVNWCEDRATIVGALMTRPEVVEGFSRADEVLAAKVQVVKQDFYRRSGGLMDEWYFYHLAMGKVNANYWRKRLRNAS